VELDKLHIFQRHAGQVGDCSSAAGVDVGVGRIGIDAPLAASGDDDGVGSEGLQGAAGDMEGHHADGPPIVNHQARKEPLVVEGDVTFEALLPQRVQQLMSRAVGGVAGTGETRPAKRPLGDSPVRETVKVGSPVLQF